MSESVELNLSRSDLISDLERLHRIMAGAHSKPEDQRKMVVWKDDLLAVERAIRELRA
jgi:hypothetical protein